jgi:ornithine cyclodeaminase/alanine dehydrogenase
MAALSSRAGLASVKLLADMPGNAHAGLPTQRSSIVMVSSATGEPLALMDGRLPTRIRTAAASAVAVRHLARPEVRTLGLIGAGALAIAHVAAILEVRDVERIAFWTRSDRTAATFTAAVRHHGLEVTRLEHPRDVVVVADVLCTLTPSEHPIVSGADFHPGLHVNAVGARPRPDHREVDTLGMLRSQVFVDSVPTAEAKSGDVVIPVREGRFSVCDIRGELGDVIAGTVVGRRTDDDITLFKSVGLGIQDLAIGGLLLDRALEAGRGTAIDLAS